MSPSSLLLPLLLLLLPFRSGPPPPPRGTTVSRKILGPEDSTHPTPRWEFPVLTGAAPGTLLSTFAALGKPPLPCPKGKASPHLRDPRAALFLLPQQLFLPPMGSANPFACWAPGSGPRSYPHRCAVLSQPAACPLPPGLEAIRLCPRVTCRTEEALFGVSVWPLPSRGEVSDLYIVVVQKKP